MITRSTWHLAAALTAALTAACGTATPHDDATCGDSVLDGTEQCDDGNTISGDGCSSSCLRETGNATCGDGVLAGGEACDDANTMADDGCSAACTVEAGYTCTGTPSTCVEGGAGASGTCGAPFELVLADNAGTLEGVGTGDTTSGADQVAEAACDGFDSGAGHDHVWKFTLPDTRDVVILMDDTSAFDTVVRVMAAPCDVTTEISEFAGADGCADAEGPNEFMGFVAMPAGTYYVVIDGYTAADVGAYGFTLEAFPPACGNGLLDPLEFCDDGDTTAGDGCDAKCEVEDGYSCDYSEPSVCTPDAPPPGNAMPPAPGDLVLNEIMAGDNMSDTNCDGSTSSSADEFVELVNVSNKTLDLTGVTIADSVVTRHTFATTTLAPGAAVVVWGAGTPACAGVDSFAVASSGQLGLNDDGDTITVATGGASPTPLVTVTYAAVTLNVSSNLSPELTGTSYVLHTAVSGAVGPYSPGRRANGAAF